MSILVTLFAGMALSLLLGAVMRPVGGASRVPDVFALLSGLAWWLGLFVLAFLVSQRVVFSTVFVVVMHGVLVAVNYTKFVALKEPFILQDFEYFTDAIRHPRLYIPFFGIIKTLLLMGSGALTIGLFFWLEAPLPWPRAAGLLVIAMLVCGLSACLAWRRVPRLELDPVRDMAATGLIALLHAHVREYWRARQADLPQPVQNWPLFEQGASQPHMVMIQSESFFDPRHCYDFVAPSVLRHWDECRAEALASGQLRVPAWGANTVRTEAAVLTGLSADELGVHRYNPYRRLAKSPVASLASHLRGQGYRTICVHPYPAHFYLRDRVVPALGFDEFIDIDGFDVEHDRQGQYVGDTAVAERVAALLEASSQPLFVFVITMENHGPLNLEAADPATEADVYRLRPEGPLQDLSVYLGHLRNADAMMARLQSVLASSERGGSLCWYGDHVPIMPDVYRHFGEPRPETPWLIWSSRALSSPPASGTALAAEELGEYWLATVKKCH